MKRKIVAVVENHFDPIWRRRFRSDFVHNGVNYISYDKIEQYYIDENIRLAEEIPGYKFQIENPCVIENYVARFPEKKAVLKKLYADGTLKTSNTGYTIMDSNMVSAEALIRNYLASDAFFAEYVGKTPALANRSDAFGNSAQLPQILRAFGAEYLTELYYNRVTDEDVWVGLDQSAICVKKHQHLGGGGTWGKYPPCPACKGFGGDCPACGGKGIDVEAGNAQWSQIKLRSGVEDSGVMRIGGEEIMPRSDTPARIAQLAKEEGVDLSLGHWDYLLERFQKEIDQVKSGDLRGLKVHGPKYNPNTTGGYVTHIEVKQALCSAEHRLLTGETLEAMRAAAGERPRSYREIWKNYLLCGFHDASATTLVDPAYREVMELFEEISEHVAKTYWNRQDGETARIFNATSGTFNGIYESGDGRIARVRGLAPYSFGEVTFEAPPVQVELQPQKKEELVETVLTGKEEAVEVENGEVFTVENEYFVIEADRSGLRSITHKQHGVVSRILNDTRPCDFLWESDVGSAWATLEPPYQSVLLHDRTKLVCKEQGDSFVRLRYQIKVPFSMANAVGDNIINWSVTLFDGYDRVRLDAEVDWLSVQKRLRVCFPLAVENSKDIYGIPGGRLERAPYEPEYVWNGANGDWPAFRYGGAESPQKSVAVFNRGTPSYKILPEEKGKVLYVSLLRSSNLPVCLHEKVGSAGYAMHDYDGLRNEGHHSFALELAAYGTAFAHSTVEADAESFARPPLGIKETLPAVEMPAVTGGFARITHVKPAEDGNGIIVRVTEYGGAEGEATVKIPAWVKEVYRTDLPERKAEKLEFGDTVTLKLRAFELATLRIL